jgi:hypothetical protein
LIGVIGCRLIGLSGNIFIRRRVTWGRWLNPCTKCWDRLNESGHESVVGCLIALRLQNCTSSLFLGRCLFSPKMIPESHCRERMEDRLRGDELCEEGILTTTVGGRKVGRRGLYVSGERPLVWKEGVRRLARDPLYVKHYTGRSFRAPFRRSAPAEL